MWQVLTINILEVEMARRKKLRKKRSRKIFTRGAMRVHPRNGLKERPMRGGIRL